MAQQQVSNSVDAWKRLIKHPYSFMKILFLINVSFNIYIYISEFEFLRFHIYII